MPNRLLITFVSALILSVVPSIVPEARAVSCGNGLLEAGETCTDCPADCAVQSCSATASTHTVAVNLAVPPEQNVLGLTLVLGYHSGTVSLPGSGAASSVRGRITDTPADAIVAVNDLDCALRVVLSRAAAIPAGKVLTVNFDSCGGANAPTAADFSCIVEGCAGQFGRVIGCTCSVAVEAANPK